MDFSNTTIPINALPTIEDVEFKPLERSYLKAERISYVISTLMIVGALIALFVFIEAIRLKWLMISLAALVVIVTVLGWVADKISYDFSGYAVREKDVLYRSGWFIRKTRIVPLNRIQHISVQSGPIERKFNLASISIYTAGSEQADFTIHGITETTANQIKEWLTQQINGSTTTA